MLPEFVKARLPEDIILNYPVFVGFVEKYYEWMNEYGFSKILNDYKELLYHNISSIDYENKKMKALGIDLSDVNLKVNGELLYKLLGEFLENRGNELSFRILFRIMFNAEISIVQSKDILFAPSDALYQNSQFVLITGTEPLSIDNTSLTGYKSKTMSGVETFTQLYISDQKYYLTEINNIIEKYTIGEPILVATDYKESNQILIPMYDLKIINGGKNYKVNDIVYPDNNSLYGHFRVSKITKSGIDLINIKNKGTGYKVNDKIKTKTKSHFSAYISDVDVDGQILKIEIDCKGYKFESIPEYEIFSITGSSAELELVSEKIGCVEKFEYVGFVFSNKNILPIYPQSGTGLIVEFIQVPGVSKSRYLNKKGFLGINSYILNSYDLHSHSYDLHSSVPKNKYETVFNRYVSPSGYVYRSFYKINKIVPVDTLEIIHNEINIS